ncbi:MAG: hypothetical protein CVU38_00880 [Chloroflexi bacterium HGW-Chloroflexi-1]|nr:MAG: hypothetical protein CVU38_00880 [Chloroflexi bacterium HGW-Chloroflexi-1]
MTQDNVDQEHTEEMRELQERLRALEEREARRKRSGVAGGALRGLGGLIPGLDTILEGLEESDAFQERLAAINKRVDTELREAPLKEVARDGEPGLQRRSSISARTLAPDRRSSSIPGGVRKGAERPQQKEPSADVFDEGDHLLIIAELPGVEEKDIEIKVRGDKLTLSAQAPGREYLKEVALPCPVEAAAQTSYRNGILQIELTKRER